MSEIILPNGVTLKKIPSLPRDNYMAGNDGRIYSNARKVKAKNGSEWYLLEGSKTRQKYSSILIYYNGKPKRYLVHRLVCEAFCGLSAEGKSQVRHLDGNPQNNVPENLAWGDGFDNWRDKKGHGRGYEGEKHPRSKLTDFERKAIKWVVEKNIAGINHIARMLEMHHSSIIHICNDGKKYNA